MKQETMTMKEFIVIMIAGAILTAGLYKTNQPPSQLGNAAAILGTPRLGVQMGSERIDPNQPALWSASDPYFSDHVAPAQSLNSGWSCGFSSFWSGAWSAISGSIGRWLMPSSCY